MEARAPSALEASTDRAGTTFNDGPGKSSKFYTGANAEVGSALLHPCCQCELIPAAENVMQPAVLGTEEREKMAIWSPVNVLGTFKRKG